VSRFFLEGALSLKGRTPVLLLLLGICMAVGAASIGEDGAALGAGRLEGGGDGLSSPTRIVATAGCRHVLPHVPREYGIRRCRTLEPLH
jgi:hypothetical protein